MPSAVLYPWGSALKYENPFGERVRLPSRTPKENRDEREATIALHDKLEIQQGTHLTLNSVIEDSSVLRLYL